MKSRCFVACLIALTTCSTLHAAAAGAVPEPLRFEPNRGQADSRVQFQALGGGYGIFFTSSDVVLALHRGQKTSVLQMSFEASQPAQLSAEDALASHTNYLIGDDPRQWHTDIPNFTRIRYGRLYRGVDAVFYGKQRKLEYDLVLAPGASLRPLVLRFDGARSIALSRRGDLLIKTEMGTLIQHRPFAYQRGVRGLQRVIVGYELRQGNRVAFRIGNYDRTREL